MFCPSCGKQIADNAKFCEFCGNIMDDQMQSEVRTGSMPNYAPKAKSGGWQPWMNVLTVTLVTVIGAGLIWWGIIGGISKMTRDVMAMFGLGTYDSWDGDYYGDYGDYYGDYDEWDDYSDYYTDGMFGADYLTRTWSMTTADGQSIWWATFDGSEVELELQSEFGTDDYGSYEYVLISDSELYIPQADQVFTYEINDGGNMLTISPGLVSDASEEYSFNFGMLP